MRQTAVNAVYQLAKRDERVVFVGSDLGSGLLDDMKREMPSRFFMEGVSEQHLIGMAAGLAMDGYIPYVNTIATFLTRRCYEQIAIDLCLHALPVRLIANGGGLVYAPLGPTHLAIEDLSLMRSLPNMNVVAPADAPEMQRLMDASLEIAGPLYIRLGKGGDPVVSDDANGFTFGKAIVMRPGADVMFISTGVMTNRALAAAQGLDAHGVSAGVLHVHTIKPLDVEAIRRCAQARLVVTVEEHVIAGGLGSAVAELLCDEAIPTPVLRLALPDAFPHGFGSQDYLLELARLQPGNLIERVSERLSALSTLAR